MKRLFSLMAALWAAAILTVGGVAADPGYRISSLSVNLTVRTDGSVDVTERIAANYQVPMHGFFRFIPHRYTADFGAGTHSYAVRLIGRPTSADPCAVFSAEDGTRVRLGNPDRSAVGYRETVLRYTLAMEDPHPPAGQAFFWDLVGTRWDAPPEEVFFSLTLPAVPDAVTLRIGTADGGEPLIEGTDYEWIAPTVLEGRAPRALHLGEGLSLTVALPNGTIRYGAAPEPAALALGGALVFAALGALFWIRFGQNPLAPPIATTVPPGNLSPAELGFLADTTINARDLTALILHWHVTGRLILEPQADGEICFTKIAALPDDANPGEQTLFEDLFYDRDSVTTRKLANTFYPSMLLAAREIPAGIQAAQPFFDPIAQRVGRLAHLLAPLSVAVPAVLWRTGHTDPSAALLIGAVAVLGALGVSTLWIVALRQQLFAPIPRPARFAPAAIATAAMLCFLLLLMPISTMGAASLTATLAACALLILDAAFLKTRRTAQGTARYAELLGYREFLCTASPDDLDAAHAHSSDAFDRALPYAWALEVPNEWAARFPPRTSDPAADDAPAQRLARLAPLLERIQSRLTLTPQEGGPGKALRGRRR